jgi:hypothetical protein
MSFMPFFFPAATGFTGAEIDRTLGTIITDFALRTTIAQDGITSQGAGVGTRHGTPVANRYYGKTGNIARIISKATVYGSNDAGYCDAGGETITIALYGKQGSAPANGTDGTSLGSINFTDQADESAGRDITSSDTTTLWDHWWVYIQTSSSDNMSLAEVKFFE